MNLTQVMARDVAAVIEETAAYITNTLAMHTLNKEGKVTLNEAKYFERLAKEVLMEAAEELIPDEIEVPDEALQESTQTQTQAKQLEESTKVDTKDETKVEELTESEAIVNKLIDKLL